MTEREKHLVKEQEKRDKKNKCTKKDDEFSCFSEYNSKEVTF